MSSFSETYNDPKISSKQLQELQGHTTNTDTLFRVKFNKWHGFETETCNIAVNKTKIGSNSDSKEGKQKHNGKIPPSST